MGKLVTNSMFDNVTTEKPQDESLAGVIQSFHFHEKMENIVLIYIGNVVNITDSIRAKIDSPLYDWLYKDCTDVSLLLENIPSLTSIAIIGTSTEQSQCVLNKGRLTGKTEKYYRWIIQTETLITWENFLNPGEKAVLVRYPLEQNYQVKEQKHIQTAIALYALSLETEKLHMVGKYHPSIGINFRNNNLWKLDRFSNKTFKVVSVKYNSGIHTSYNETTGRWSGLAFDILEGLSNKLNFSVIIEESPSGIYGHPNENGTWHGMVAEVMSGHYDIAVAGITITSSRADIVDFTTAYYTDYVTMLMKTYSDQGQCVLVAPFQLPVWILVLVSLPLFSLMVTVMSYVYPGTKSSSSNGNLHRISSFIKSWGAWFWLSFGFIMLQGGELPNYTVANKLASLGFLLYVIALAAVYNGNLTAFLTVQKMVKPVETFEELATRTDLNYGCLHGSAFYADMQLAKSGVLRDLWLGGAQYYKNNNHENMRVSVDRVKEHGYIYMEESAYTRPFLATNCELAISDSIYESNLALVLPKNSPYKPAFDKAIIQMLEGGLVDQWALSHITKGSCDGKDVDTSSKAITLLQIYWMFVVVFVGVFLAICVLFAECIVFRVKSTTVCSTINVRPVFCE